MGTSILQLVVTDRDSFHNGPPFSFSILSGNEDEEFMLDSHGILRSAVVFRHMESPEYLLCIQVQLCCLSTLGAAFFHICPSAFWLGFFPLFTKSTYLMIVKESSSSNPEFHFLPIKTASVYEMHVKLSRKEE